MAAARAVWFVAQDPHDWSRGLLLQLKNNLGERISGLAFRIETSEEGGAPVVRWEDDPVTMSAEEIVKLARAQMRNLDGERRKTPREEAGECLQALLADGPRMCHALLRDAENQGFTERTIRRALHDLGVVSRRTDMGDYYYALPGQEKDVPDSHVWLWLQERERKREMG